MNCDELDKRTKAYRECIEAQEREENKTDFETFKENYEKASEGLGDDIEKITEKTGIKKAVKFLYGEDCGCDKRKDKLNKLFPHNKPECFTEEEYNWLTQFFQRPNKNTVDHKQQQRLVDIYNRVLHYRETTSNCSRCVKEIIHRLQKVYNTYNQ